MKLFSLLIAESCIIASCGERVDGGDDSSDRWVDGVEYVWPDSVNVVVDDLLRSANGATICISYLGPQGQELELYDIIEEFSGSLCGSLIEISTMGQILPDDPYFFSGVSLEECWRGEASFVDSDPWRRWTRLGTSSRHDCERSEVILRVHIYYGESAALSRLGPRDYGMRLYWGLPDIDEVGLARICPSDWGTRVFSDPSTAGGLLEVTGGSPREQAPTVPPASRAVPDAE